MPINLMNSGSASSVASPMSFDEWLPTSGMPSSAEEYDPWNYSLGKDMAEKIYQDYIHNSYSDYVAGYYEDLKQQNINSAFGQFMNRDQFNDVASVYGMEVALDMASSGFNALEAQKQRDYEERLANTAYRRAVKDIEGAGLNKWLALNGGSFGASATPSGATASYSSGSSGYASVYRTDKQYEARIISSILNTATKLISSAVTLGLGVAKK